MHASVLFFASRFLKKAFRFVTFLFTLYEIRDSLAPMPCIHRKQHTRTGVDGVPFVRSCSILPLVSSVSRRRFCPSVSFQQPTKPTLRCCNSIGCSLKATDPVESLREDTTNLGDATTTRNTTSRDGSKIPRIANHFVPSQTSKVRIQNSS